MHASTACLPTAYAIGNSGHRCIVEPRMRCVIGVVVGVLVASGCGGGGHRASNGNASTTTTLASKPIARSQVTDIQVEALPESPVLRWSAERAHWTEVISKLPAQLPQPNPHQTCTTGPELVVRLRSGAELIYACALPPAILTTRNYIISLSSGADPACRVALSRIRGAKLLNAQATTARAARDQSYADNRRPALHAFPGVSDAESAYWCWTQPIQGFYESYVAVANRTPVLFARVIVGSSGTPPAPGPPIVP